MPQTTTKPTKPVAQRGDGVKVPSARNAKPAASPGAPVLDRTRELSEDVLKSVETAQRAAIDAVRKFVESVDQALPVHGEGPSRRQEVVDSALEMADRLVHTQHDFIRKVIDNAGGAINKPSDRTSATGATSSNRPKH